MSTAAKGSRGRNGANEMEFPAVPPAMIARLGPMRLSVDRGIEGNNAYGAVLLMLDTAYGAQQCAVHRRRTSRTGWSWSSVTR